MEEDYRYRNVELYPDIFAELMVLLYQGKQFSRQDCIDCVVEYHKQHGGICSYKSYVSQFKKASLSLRKKGCRLENVGYGIWRLDDSSNYNSFWSGINKDFDVLREIGSGNEVVYVYYFSIYKKYSMLYGNQFWECKVGMTTKNIYDRIYSQSSTAFPEEPFIALIIRCDNGRELEQMIHTVLKEKGKWMKNVPGKEWFFTSPEEVETIYNELRESGCIK